MLLSLTGLLAGFGLRPTGVLHLGAHMGEEAADYVKNGIGDVVWVEGNPALLGPLKEQVEPYGHRVLGALLDEESGRDVDLKVTNNTQSSSILALGTHRVHHPDIDVGHSVSLQTTTVDDLAAAHDFTGLDFLNIDLQGAELRALRGGVQTLAGVRYVYTEVNREEVYEGCALIGEIDAFLEAQGLRRVITRWTPAQWGDALYVRPGAARRLGGTARARLRAIEAREGLQARADALGRAVKDVRSRRGSGT